MQFFPDRRPDGLIPMDLSLLQSGAPGILCSVQIQCVRIGLVGGGNSILSSYFINLRKKQTGSRFLVRSLVCPHGQAIWKRADPDLISPHLPLNMRKNMSAVCQSPNIKSRQSQLLHLVQ